MIDLLHTDCMDYMATCEDNAFDLAIVDPPYGLGDKLTNGGVNSKSNFSNQINSNSDKWDIVPDKKYFNELWRVSKNQIIWGGNYFDLPPTRGVISWDKLKDHDKNGSHWEMALTSFDKRALIYRQSNQGGFCMKIQKIHPTQKPVKLYDWLLANYAKEGDRILDTHLGSGSSAIAAHYGGFYFVGCELDPDYYAAAKKRFDLETSQIDIFGGAA